MILGFFLLVFFAYLLIEIHLDCLLFGSQAQNLCCTRLVRRSILKHIIWVGWCVIHSLVLHLWVGIRSCILFSTFVSIIILDHIELVVPELFGISRITKGIGCITPFGLALVVIDLCSIVPFAYSVVASTAFSPRVFRRIGRHSALVGSGFVFFAIRVCVFGIIFLLILLGVFLCGVHTLVSSNAMSILFRRCIGWDII